MVDFDKLRLENERSFEDVQHIRIIGTNINHLQSIIWIDNLLELTDESMFYIMRIKRERQLEHERIYNSIRGRQC